MADQTKFEDVLKSWETFLRGTKSRYIRIQNMDDGQYVMDRTKISSPTMFFMVDILKTHQGIGPWFDDILIKYDLRNIKMYFRKTSGGSGTVNDPKFADTIYKTSSRLEHLKNIDHKPMETSTAAPVKTIPDNTPEQQQTPSPTNDFAPALANFPQNGLGAATMTHMGGLGQAALAAGMGLPELIEVKKKADRSDEYLERLRKVEEELHSSTIRNRELESKVSIAEQSKEIAVQLAKLENKGFMDSEAAQKIIESIPNMIAMMANNGGVPGAQPVGLSAGAPLSEAKSALIGYVEDDMCTDEMANMLTRSIYLLASSPAYIKELNELNSKEHVNINGNG